MVKIKEMGLFSGIVSFLVLADLLAKQLILKYQPEIDLSVLKIHLIKNTGAGFGILKNQRGLLILISFLVILFIVYYYPKLTRNLWLLLFTTFFLGGTIGNLIDRLFLGYVIDFIDFSFWPAFNLADSFVTLGAFGLIFYLSSSSNKIN